MTQSNKKMPRDEVKIIIAPKARRQIEWMKEEMEIDLDSEFFKSAIGMIYRLLKDLPKGKEGVIYRK